HPYLAGHGYAGVRVDLRGCGESSGLLSDEYAKQEQDDGAEVIAWLAAQPWCSGVVGMMGISWGGFNGLQIAARRPPALKAIVTICSTDDRYADDVHYMGGTLLAADGLEWGSFLFGSMCLPPDPMLVGDRWRAMWLERLANVPLFFETWLQHQRRDGYWKHGSVCEDYAAIQCPVYAVGGWTDAYTNAIPRLLGRLSVPRKGLIGPWAHGYPHFARPGPQIGFLQEMLRWWDYWLKGIDTGVMDEPMLCAWMTESVKPASGHEPLPGRWVAEASWPPSGITPQRLFLTDEGLRNEAAPLTARAVCSPQTVGKCGKLGSVRSWTRPGGGSARRRHALAGVRDAAPRYADRDPRRADRHARPRIRQAGGEPGGSVMRCASVRRVAPGQLRHTQPHPSRRTRNACAAGGRTTLPSAYKAQRRRLGIFARPPDKARPIHGLLADDLACSRTGDTTDFGRHAPSASTPTPSHRRAAAAAARAGVGATREADDHPSQRHAHRAHRPPRP